MEEKIGYKKLIVWQKSDELVFLVYRITSSFPKQELFALTSQLRRAALSTPTNIVEGYARNSKPEFKRFIVFSLGSIAEVKYLLSVAFRLGYMSPAQYKDIIEVAESVGQLLWKFYRTL